MRCEYRAAMGVWAERVLDMIAVAPVSEVMHLTGMEQRPHSTPPERKAIRAEARAIVIEWLRKDAARPATDEPRMRPHDHVERRAALVERMEREADFRPVVPEALDAYVPIFLDGGGDPDFAQIDAFLRAHFNAHAVYNDAVPEALDVEIAQAAFRRAQAQGISFDLLAFWRHFAREYDALRSKEPIE